MLQDVAIETCPCDHCFWHYCNALVLSRSRSCITFGIKAKFCEQMDMGRIRCSIHI
uniref:Uncharacterized protein n=1 Tax=Rhizophora mucronata TaxID=61149 RepID=A0A2P2NW57_RHIMU